MLAASAALLFAAVQPDGPAAPPHAPAWSFEEGVDFCTATTRFPGGAVLHIGYARNESYFQLWDPAWPPLRDSGFLNVVLRFGPGDELAARGTATPVIDNDRRLGIILLPVAGTERLQRLRAGTFRFVVDGRDFGTYRPGTALEPLFTCVAAKRGRR